MEEQVIQTFIGAIMIITFIVGMACCICAGYIKGKHKGEDGE